MKKGGKGGARTQTGLHFEKRSDLVAALVDLPGFSVKGFDIFKNSELVARNCKKHKLYVFLKEQGIDYKKIISKQLLPDEAIYIPAQKKLYIVELKFQEIGGSVDEKLQTCDFKKKQYSKLFAPLGIDIEYSYVLNEWFMKPAYRDVLNYVSAMGCKAFFKTLPIEELGL